MNKILIFGIGFVVLGTQAAIAAPVNRYGTQPPADVIINSDPQALPAPPSSQYPPSSSPQTTQASDVRFTCQYFNGQPTVMYNPTSQPGRAYPWAVPKTLGDGWSAQRRCQEISQRLEMYRPDGLAELQTGYQNNYQTICVTTERVPGCRIVLTVPPGQSAEVIRDRVFESISVADSGQMTQGVNAYTGGQNNNFLNQLGQLFNGGKPSPLTQPTTQKGNGINLRPFLEPADGGTGEKLTKSLPKSAPTNTTNRSNRFNSGQFR